MHDFSLNTLFSYIFIEMWTVSKSLYHSGTLPVNCRDCTFTTTSIVYLFVSVLLHYATYTVYVSENSSVELMFTFLRNRR